MKTRKVRCTTDMQRLATVSMHSMLSTDVYKRKSQSTNAEGRKANAEVAAAGRNKVSLLPRRESLLGKAACIDRKGYREYRDYVSF